MSVTLGASKRPQRVVHDPEFWLIVLYNLALLYAYLQNKQEGIIVIWGYYIQSLFVGLTHMSKALLDKWRGKSVEVVSSFNAKHNDVDPDSYKAIFFFGFHYGFFHLVYSIFLLAMMSVAELGDQPIVLRGLGELSFFEFLKFSAAYCFVGYVLFMLREAFQLFPDRPTPPLHTAYFRIIPIHLFIIVGGFVTVGLGGMASSIAFLVFILLKLVADLLLYRSLYGRRSQALDV